MVLYAIWFVITIIDLTCPFQAEIEQTASPAARSPSPAGDVPTGMITNSLQPLLLNFNSYTWSLTLFCLVNRGQTQFCSSRSRRLQESEPSCQEPPPLHLQVQAWLKKMMSQKATTAEKIPKMNSTPRSMLNLPPTDRVVGKKVWSRGGEDREVLT